MMSEVTSSVTRNGPDAPVLPEGIAAVAFGPWFEDRAKEIRAHLKSMNKSADKAEQHRKSALHILNSVEKRLTAADGKLDTLRFDLFKSQVCPDLERSQAYIKLAILKGTLTIEDHRKAGRDRKRKYDDKKKKERAARAEATTLALKAGNGGDGPTASELARLAREGKPLPDATDTAHEPDPELEPTPAPETDEERSDRLLAEFKTGPWIEQFKGMTLRDMEQGKNYFLSTFDRIKKNHPAFKAAAATALSGRKAA